MKGKILFLSAFSFLAANGADVPKPRSVGYSCLRRRGDNGVWHRVEKKVSGKVAPRKNDSVEEDEFIDADVKLVCGCIPVCVPSVRVKVE